MFAGVIEREDGRQPTRSDYLKLCWQEMLGTRGVRIVSARAYKLREKDGKQMYCRKEAPLGTRLPKMVCLNKDELTDRVLAAQQGRDTLILPKAGDCGTSTVGC